MESQDADKTESKPLTFDDVEDIPDIDGEDTSQSTSEDVTVIHKIVSDERHITNGSTQDLKTGSDGLTTAVSENSGKGQDERPSSPQVSQGDKDIAEECVTFSMSFALKPEVQNAKSDGKEETDSNVGEDCATDSQTLQDSAPKAKTKSKKLKKIATKDNRDSDSSVSSKQKSKSSKTHVKSKFAPGSFEYIEAGLRGKIFSGWIEERKWVENLSGYRDIIEVNEWEVEINQMLMSVIKSIPGVLEGKKWINITPPNEKEPCFCIWTLLATPPIPGHYWFTVTGVALHPQFGLRVMLKIVRSINPNDSESAEARQKRRKDLSSCEPGKELETLSAQVNDWLDQVRQISISSVWTTVSSTLTISNIREAIRFVIVLSMTIVVGLVAFIKGSHQYGLQFMHASGIFFRNITPFLQSVLSFFEKIIGGFYLLIAMVYRDVRRPSPPQPPPYPAICRPPMTIGGGQSFSQSPVGPRTVKYVPPEQWVYKSQNSTPPDPRSSS